MRGFEFYFIDFRHQITLSFKKYTYLLSFGISCYKQNKVNRKNEHHYFVALKNNALSVTLSKLIKSIERDIPKIHKIRRKVYEFWLFTIVSGTTPNIRHQLFHMKLHISHPVCLSYFTTIDTSIQVPVYHRRFSIIYIWVSHWILY